MSTVKNLIDQLKRDEGEVLRVYKDSLGIPTAGVGHNLIAHGIELPVGTVITQEQSDQWLKDDIQTAEAELYGQLPWVEKLDDYARRSVLINMTFNMGIKGLCTFKLFLGLVQQGSYEAASEHMLNSLWARQVGSRATRLSLQMKTGEWQ